MKLLLWLFNLLLFLLFSFLLLGVPTFLALICFLLSYDSDLDNFNDSFMAFTAIFLFTFFSICDLIKKNSSKEIIEIPNLHSLRTVPELENYIDKKINRNNNRKYIISPSKAIYIFIFGLFTLITLYNNVEMFEKFLGFLIFIIVLLMFILFKQENDGTFICEPAIKKLEKIEEKTNLEGFNDPDKIRDMIIECLNKSNDLRRFRFWILKWQKKFN